MLQTLSITACLVIAGGRPAMAINTTADGYKAPGGVTTKVTIYNGKCYNVTPSAGMTLFVPTRNALEWGDFANWAAVPAHGTTVAGPVLCVCAPQDYTVSQSYDVAYVANSTTDNSFQVCCNPRGMGATVTSTTPLGAPWGTYTETIGCHSDDCTECGDGSCLASETDLNCPADCGCNNNGVCQAARGEGTTYACADCCAGKLYAGYCWYLAGTGTSCTDTCASHTGYNNGTCTFGWPHCQDVVSQFVSSPTPMTSPWGGSTGCSYLDGGESGPYAVTDNTSCSESGSFFFLSRVCACNR